ncbi:MAG: XdhC family protein [Phaeodactylibacter sp.]|nr:XdhC family protein [Phaeodactylibacter sp.]MCB9275161.1 XdhC family protein [Lewinellaceae bacterium]
MFDHFIEEARHLYQKREPFAIALVVNRQAPSSGKPGDKAVIEKNGKVSGWIGGGCTRGIVLKEAADAMRDGQPRLVRISPEKPAATAEHSNVKDYYMTCQSGGTVEVYIEPVLPRPQLLIMGKSHVAKALCRLGRAMEYTVTVVSKAADAEMFPDADNIISQMEIPEGQVFPNTCIVVCTQGENDEDALEQAVRTGAPYVAFVASRRKANGIFHTLRQRGLSFDELKGIKTPAGLDINAKLPEEAAVSILAEIIAFMRSEQAAGAAVEATDSDVFINPVCQIPVSKSTAKHVVVYKGENYYFCCDGCRDTFEQEPEKYALPLVEDI